MALSATPKTGSNQPNYQPSYGDWSPKTYVVLTAADDMPLPQAAYDDLGRPNVTVHGMVLDNHGIPALAIHSVSQ